METRLAAVQPPVTESHDGRILACVVGPGLLLAAVFYFAGATELAIGVAGLAVIVGCLLAPEISLYAFCFVQALDDAMLAQEGAILTPAKIIGPFILLTYALHPARRRTKMLLSGRFITIWLAFGIYGVAMAPVAMAPLAALRFGGQIIVLALIIVVAVHRLSNRVLISRALLFAVLSGVVASVQLVLLGVQSRQFSGAALGDFGNPNSTALALSTAIVCVPAAWATTRHKWLRIALLAAAPLMLTAMLKTGSRSALIAVFFSAVASVALVRRAGMMQRIIIPAFCAVVVAVTVSVVLQSGQLGERPQARLEQLVEGGVEFGRESRTGIWAMALDTYLRQPWGFGYGSTGRALGAARGMNIDVHSSVLGALVEGGPIAFVLFLLGLWFAFRAVRSIKQGGLGIPAMMLFIFVIVSTLTHTIHYSKWFWIPLMFCMVLAEQARREELQARQGTTVPAAPLTGDDLLRDLGPSDAVVYGP